MVLGLWKDAAMRMQVACDTPLGVEFVTFESKGTGAVLVVERLVEKFAEARNWKPDECDLIQVVDEETSRIVWPKTKPRHPLTAAVWEWLETDERLQTDGDKKAAREAVEEIDRQFIEWDREIASRAEVSQQRSGV